MKDLLKPIILMNKILLWPLAKFKEGVKRICDYKHCTYEINFPKGELNRYFASPALAYLIPQKEFIRTLVNHYLLHRFDLLGSGWVQVKHGMNCRGLEGCHYQMSSSVKIDKEGRWLEDRINLANLKESKRIWSLIDTDYFPIDWHIDFKSGFRWSESTWYKDVRFGHKLGADIKLSWELSRMQHLPQLAHSYALAKEGLFGSIKPEIYYREFRNQVLDFIATNPVRFGVNWRCTMDVAIRAANWLVTYDLFIVQGIKFDAAFNNVFCRSIYEHGKHIINNLEWSRTFRCNHYLADIVGLLFISSYLPITPETDAWLVFSLQELINEVAGQFYPEGSNVEASTSYHRLSAELVVYATALVLGLSQEKKKAFQNYGFRLHKVLPRLKPAPLKLYLVPSHQCYSPFPTWYFEWLEKMGYFTMQITKPNKHIPQIGDNDNGRFLKLQPIYQKITVKEAKTRYLNLESYTDLSDDSEYLLEDLLDHRHLVAAINAFFERQDFKIFVREDYIDSYFIKNLLGNISIPSFLQLKERTIENNGEIKKDNVWSKYNSYFDALPERQKRIFKIQFSKENLSRDLKHYAFTEFGMYIYCSENMYLSIRCGYAPNGRSCNNIHAHNDQLSIELNIDGKDLIIDPGAYIYTPLPKRRNEFRSVKVHFTPHPDTDEPAPLGLGLFYLRSRVNPQCLYFSQKGFIGRYQFRGIDVYRIVEIIQDCIIIKDFFESNIFFDILSFKRLSYPENASFAKPKFLSTGYGILMSYPKVSLRNEKNFTDYLQFSTSCS